MNDTDFAPAMFEKLFEDLRSLKDSELTWLEIATRLLTFCHEYRPSPSSWVGHDQAETRRTIYNVGLTAVAELVAVDRDFFSPRPGHPMQAKPLPSSYATHDHVNALEKVANDARASSPFTDKRLTLATVARGLAGAIDDLAGPTFMEWFRRYGELTIEEGKPHPVCNHNPSRWLGQEKPNTNPAKYPRRELSRTPSLRIATEPLGYSYVLDFNLWNRLAPLGSGAEGLVMAALQPNLNVDEFSMKWDTDPSVWRTNPPTWYANHGPEDAGIQIDRITRLVDDARAEHAQVVILPEYAVSEPVYHALDNSLLDSSAFMVFCAGITIPDTNDFVKNQAWLSVSTPKVDRHYAVHFHAKTSGAALHTADERIRAATEVRVFISQQWSLCVLICIETLDSAIIDQLAKIGVNLLLVPSMSRITNAMIGKISNLCTDSQAFVAMANGPASWPGSDDQRCEVFFAGPYAKAPSSWSENRTIGVTTPPSDIAYWLFRSAGPNVACQQLPSH